jgi:serine/threonine-protein kinase
MTQAGMILGTAAYMSPEQARGKPVDRRADIWAFGCVLYEMITGQRAFEDEDVSLTLSKVLRLEPDAAALPSGTPPRVRQVLRVCLQKDLRKRASDIHDVRLALEGTFESQTVSGPSALMPALPAWRRMLPFAATAAAAVLVTGLAAWSLWPPALAPRHVTRLDYVLPDGQQLRNPQRSALTISPDGRAFVYLTAQGFRLREMGELASRLIAGTNGATNAFFSPDGQTLAFFSQGQLRKVALSGGTPVTLSEATDSGGSWTTDGTILFVGPSGLMRVSSNGGTPELLVPAREGEQMYGPRMLPAGDAVLFSVTTDRGPSRWSKARVEVHSLETGARTVVLTGGHDARYLDSGHLVYAVSDTLMGVARPRSADGHRRSRAARPGHSAARRSECRRRELRRLG